MNGAVAEPRLIVVVPGSRLVLIATPERLDRPTLAPPPPPPKQFPTVVQTVPVLAGKVMVLLPLRVANAREVVLAPLPTLKVLEAEPCKSRIPPVLPTVMVDAPSFMAVTVVSEVMSELAPLAAALRLVLAPEAVVAPVPPLATLKAVDNVKPPKVGVELVPMFWGRDSVIAPVDELALTWLAVPVILLTPEPETAKPQLAEFSRQIVPVALGRVNTWVPPVAVPVSSKLLDVEPPRYRLLNGAVAEPRLIVVEPASRLVLIATLLKLDSDALAPPPLPKQLPIVVQTVPVLAGKVMVLLPLRAANAREVVLAPLPATIVLETEPCRVKVAPVVPTVRLDAPSLTAVTVVSEVMSELAPLAAAARSVLAPEAVVEPVPPLVTASGVVLRVKPAKVGVEVVAMLWGNERVILPADELAITWLAVPVILVTPEPDEPKPQLAEFSRQIVPLALGRVRTCVPPLAVPVSSKLLDVEPPRYRLLNGAVAEPRLIVVVPGSRLVLIATPERLDRPTLAPPPLPKQLPIVVQTVPVLAGKVMVLLPLRAANAREVVLAPLPTLKVLVLEPCRSNIPPVLPTVMVAAPSLMAVTVVSEVMSELAPLAAALKLPLAPAAVVEPVPPLITLKAVLRFRPPNVGVELVPMFWGKDSVIAPVEALALTWLAVPVMLLTPEPETAKPQLTELSKHMVPVALGRVRT